MNSTNPLALSRVTRHLSLTPRKQHQAVERSSSPVLPGDAMETRTRFAPLQHLQAYLQHVQKNNEDDLDSVLASLQGLGREVHDLLETIELHFNAGIKPFRSGQLDLQIGARTPVTEVRDWMIKQLVPIAESRGRTLEVHFDSVVSTLPANIMYRLLVEHVRKRLYDSPVDDVINVQVSTTNGVVSIRVIEYGTALPLSPITDESTRELWARVVHLYSGTVAWRSEPADDCGRIRNTIAILYPIDAMHQFDSATQALRSMRPDLFPAGTAA